ncbi:ABC transporter permease [Chloroflexota bacterium]
MIRSLVVARREVQSYLLDRADLAFSLLLPIVIFALMFGAFSGESLFNGTAYVVNEDQGGIFSNRLIERLNELDNLEVSLITRQEAHLKLDRSDILLVAFIPEDFSARLTNVQETQILFRQRGNGGQEGQIVASLIRGEADRMSQEIQIERQVQRALTEEAIGAEHVRTTVNKIMDREREFPVIRITENIIGADIDPIDQFLPGIVTMFVLFTITLGSRAIVEERKMGTLERLLTTKLSISQLFLGKFLSGTARGFVQTLILLTLAYAVFQLFTPLSFVSVLLASLIFSAAASALGLVIASVARSEDQAVWISVFFTMATVMVGGTFFEVPEDSWLFLLSRISLNTYANNAFKTLITRGGNLSDVSFDLLVMGVVVIAGLILSRLLIKTMIGGKQ